MLGLYVAIYIISAVTVIWSFADHGVILSLIIAAVWAALLLSLKKLGLKIPIAMTAAAFTLVASVVTILTYPEDGLEISLRDVKKSGQEEVEKEEVEDPDGTIVVDGGSGTLATDKYDTMSYIAESARGTEAYLASKDATASYQFEATRGQYQLWVKLSDDALHFDGSRSVTIVLNGLKTVKYEHVSKDTSGWEWFKLEDVELIEGLNSITFTKDASTSAAYVMDEFKFVPTV